MTFIQKFRLANHLLVLLGIASLAMSNFLPYLILFLPLIAIYLTEKLPPEHFLKQPPRWLVNGITLLLFAYFTTVTFLIQEDLIGAVIYFTIYLQLLKVLTSTKNRDYFQCYLLALLHLIAATMLTSDLVFIIPFVLFIILAPWTFTLYNLKNQLEKATNDRNLVEHQLNSRQVIGNRFFLATAALSLLLLINTMVIFFMFPRVSFGFLFKKMKAGTTSSGFSDKVDLNSFGDIKNNDTIVMRVETSYPLDASDINDLYWRGLAYDEYRGNRWLRTSEERRKLNINIYTGQISLRKRDPLRAFEHKIFLEPIDTTVLFAAESIQSLSWDKMYMERMLRQDLSILRDDYNSVYFNSSNANDRIYSSVSDLYQVPESELRRQNNYENIRTDFIETYTQLPQFSPEFYELAQQLAKGQSTVYDKVNTLLNHLRNNFSYTLRIQKFTDNPIEEFLFKKKQGHCEYFASSSVLLLRAMNIPARLVSGFRGGEWNEYGKYLIVRQRDAHTWIEVWFPNIGWQRFDPTPPDNLAPEFQTARFAALQKMVDYLELRWYKYIINYDLHSQYKAAKAIWSRTSTSFKGMRNLSGEESYLKRFQSWMQAQNKNKNGGRGTALFIITLLGIAVAAIGLFVGIKALVRYLIRRYLHPHKPHQIILERYKAVIAAKGIKPQKTQTPLELHKRFAEKYPTLQDSSLEIVNRYYGSRFGDVELDGATMSKLNQQIEELRGHDT